MSSRAVIEQAKGVLVGHLHVGAEEAFAALRLSSRQTNAKLRDLAAQVVARAQQGKPVDDLVPRRVPQS